MTVWDDLKGRKPAEGNTAHHATPARIIRDSPQSARTYVIDCIKCGAEGADAGTRLCNACRRKLWTSMPIENDCVACGRDLKRHSTPEYAACTAKLVRHGCTPEGKDIPGHVPPPAPPRCAYCSSSLNANGKCRDYGCRGSFKDPPPRDNTASTMRDAALANISDEVAKEMNP